MPNNGAEIRGRRDDLAQRNVSVILVRSAFGSSDERIAT